MFVSSGCLDGHAWFLPGALVGMPVGDRKKLGVIHVSLLHVGRTMNS